MSNSERHPKDEPKKEPGRSDPPDLDAIIPENPPSPNEVFSELDDYQKKLESDWESAKSSYRSKINDIMEDFLENDGKSNPRQTSKRYESLLESVERTLESRERKNRLLSWWKGDNPSVIQIAWRPMGERVRGFFNLGLIAAIVGGLAYFAISALRLPAATPLPYAHPSSVFFMKGEVLIVDWFRKTLYIHENKKGLPIRAIENLPNNFITGFAMSPEKLWTLDGFNKAVAVHTLSADHRVTSQVKTPGERPAGLFFDGRHLWSADLGRAKVFQHHPSDPSEIINEYSLPNVHVTAFLLRNNRFWVLDGPSREMQIYRLQEPPRLLASYDLDPYLKGAQPTGFTVEGKDVWLLTENPSQLQKVSLKKLEKKSALNDF